MIADALKKLARLFWLLPGFLLWASFPPMAEKTDCVFALAPLIWFARNRDSKANFRLWFLNGFVFWFATLSWMPAIVKNGGPWPLVVLGWGALAAYCALYFGAFGWLSSKVWAWVKDEGTAWRKPPRFPYARRLFAILIAEPLLWCGLELLRSRLFGGFSWNHLGLPLVNANLGSPAALGGVYLVSAVVILVNGTIAGIAERIMKRTTRWASLETLIPFLLIWGIYALGGFCMLRIATNSSEGGWETESRTVAMVQRNFPCVFKPTEREDPIAVYSNLLANVAYTRPDLVVLAESALSEFGAADSPRSLAFARWVAKSTGAREVIAGGGRFADGKEYNSAVLFSDFGLDVRQSGCSMQIYDKVHLVPFGEFIPVDYSKLTTHNLQLTTRVLRQSPPRSVRRVHSGRQVDHCAPEACAGRELHSWRAQAPWRLRRCDLLRGHRFRADARAVALGRTCACLHHERQLVLRFCRGRAARLAVGRARH